MTNEEMAIEAAESMMKYGHNSPRRTDLIFKIRKFMGMFGVGDRSPCDLLNALDVAGLKIDHAPVTNGDSE